MNDQQATSDQSEEGPDLSVPTEQPTAGSAVLRWWPAAVLLVVMGGLRSLLTIIEAPTLPVMLLGFIGSGAVGSLLLVWWLFASRTSWKERLTILAGFLFIAVVVCAFLHPSLQGMGIMMFVLPTGTAAFGIGALLSANRPTIRFPVMMLATFIGFGAWSLIQAQGFSGKFQGDFLWRWEPTDEDNFLASLDQRKSVGDANVASGVDLTQAEWPSFRGKDQSGTVTGVVLSEDWDSTPPKEIWRINVGPAWSSLSVAGKRLYTQEQRGDREAIICLDAETGDIVWEHDYKSRFWEAIGGAGPRATPTITADGVFALGGDGILVRLDAATGKETWKRDLKADAEREPPTWGFASSPYVNESTVVVHAGGADDKGVLAYSIETGEIAWTAPSGPHSYSSPQAGEIEGQTGIMMLTDIGLQFLDAKDGSTIWQYDWDEEEYRVVQPLVSGNSILVGGSLGAGAHRITVSKSSDDWTVENDWTSRALKPDYNDSVLYDGYVYGFDSGIFCCIDFETGERAWKRGRYGNGQVLLLADQGQLLVISEKGQLVLIKATPEKLTEIARHDIFDGKTWNHPVLVGDRLYIRNAQEAACFKMPLEVLESSSESE